MRFSSLHPLAKLVVGLFVTSLLAGLLQIVTWVLGVDFNILANAKGARGILLFLTLAVLLGMMSLERQPLSSYGIFVGPRWKKLFFGGIAIGSGVHLLLFAVAVGAGVFKVNTDSLTPSSTFKAITSAMTSMPLAVVQQFIFSGYLLTMLRGRGSRTAGIVGSALLFAILGRITTPTEFWSWQNQSLLLGLFLTAAFLGTLRVKTGNIVFPAGILAGWLILGRLVGKLRLLPPVYSSPLLAWIAPAGDPRRGPLMWTALLIAIAGVAIWLRRCGESQPAVADSAFDKDFKRIFPFSHVSGFAPLDLWLKMLFIARFRIELAYLPRLAAVLCVSALNTVLTLPERMITPLLLRRWKPRDPVFILGMHRSGTTHLHYLLALDPQFCTARHYQANNPCGFLSTGWLITPLLSALVPWKRPMDNVRTHMFAPSEEEFLMLGMTAMSPYWGMTFPRQWPRFDRYLLPDQLNDAERAAWKKRYDHVVRKLTLWSRKLPLLKNPCNTARVRVLRELFPNARFIHLARNPYDVYRSNIHLAGEAHVLNQLQDPVDENSYAARYLGNYQAMEEAYNREIAEVPANRVAELRFEDLEHDPLAQLRAIYDRLELQWTPRYENRLRSYLDKVADYQKNRHRALSAEDGERVDEKLADFMRQWGYASADDSSENRQHIAA